MCLYKGTNKFSIADRDIECYKVVGVDIIKGRYYSYYQHTPITLGEPIKARKRASTEQLNDAIILKGEVVHAFQKNAFTCGYERLSYRFNRFIRLETAAHFNGSLNHAVLRCIIPKGTLYCKSAPVYDLDNNEDGFYPQYGAKVIIPVEEVPFNIVEESKLSEHLSSN